MRWHEGAPAVRRRASFYNSTHHAPPPRASTPRGPQRILREASRDDDFFLARRSSLSAFRAAAARMASTGWVCVLDEAARVDDDRVRFLPWNAGRRSRWRRGRRASPRRPPCSSGSPGRPWTGGREPARRPCPHRRSGGCQGWRRARNRPRKGGGSLCVLKRFGSERRSPWKGWRGRREARRRTSESPRRERARV